MKKLVLQLAALGILIAGLFPVAALADPHALGYTWKDIQTIQSPSGHVFHDPDWTNDPHAYIDTSASLPGCTLKSGSAYSEYNVAQLIEITAWNKPGSGTLVTFTLDKKTPGNTFCTETPTSITIDNPALAGAQYDRIDATTIKALRADSPDGQDNSTYTFNPTTKTFVQNNPGSNCHTTIAVYSDGRGASIKHSTETSPGRLSSTNSGYTYSNGCWVQNVGNYSLLGYPENASIAGGTGGGGGGGTDPQTSAEDTCANDPSTGAFAWIICPAITSTTKVMNGIYTNFIQPTLQVDPLTKDDNLNKVWAQFRNAADVLFVLVFLIVIFSTVTSVGVSSYTIKKVLPRLVAAAILVQFSWFLCGFAIDVGNILGAGISSLVNAALGSAKDLAAGPNTSSSLNMLLSNAASFGLLGGGVAVAAGVAVIAGPTLLFLLLGLLISIITLAATLVVRLLILKVLIVLAPIAIVLWVLPNTESLFKKWYQNFIKLIMMFPIIALLIAGGQIVQAAGMADKASGFQELAAILAPMIAFFLIPTAFKMSGTMMGTVSGAIAKRGSALSSGAQNSQFAKDKKAEYRGQSAQGYLGAQNKTGFGARVARTRGMLGSGNLIPTAASKRRVSAVAAGFEKTQGDEFQNQINNANEGLGFNGEDFTKLLSGEDVGTVKSTKASRKRAIEMAAKTGKWGAIRDAKASGKLNSGELAQGLSATEAWQKAPDLTMGSKGLQMSSGDSFGALHPSSKALALTQMESQLGSTDGQNTLSSVLQAAENNPGSIDIDTQNTLRGYIATPPAGMTPANVASIQDRFDGNGNLKKRAQEVKLV